MDAISFSFKKTVSQICYTLIISLLVVSVFSAFLFLAFGKDIPGILYVLMSLLMAIPFGVLAKNQGVFNIEYKKNEKISIAVRLSFASLGLLIAIAASIAATFIQYFFSRSGVELKTPGVPVSKSTLEFLINSISTAIVPAITEELMFRGVILNLLNKYNSVVAVSLSALLFAIFHGNIPQFIFALALGLYFGFVFLKTGSLGLCMFMHFVINLYAVISVALSEMVKSQILIGLVLLFMMALIFSIGVLSLFFLKGKGFLDFYEFKRGNLMSLSRCCKLAFSNSGMIVFLVIMAMLLLLSIGRKMV